MTATDKLIKVINNENVGKSFYNLYDRWRDESEYEDIKEYGKALIGSINRNCPEYNVQLVSSTKRPFGIKVKIDDVVFHIFVKIRGGYIVVSAKKV